MSVVFPGDDINSGIAPIYLAKSPSQDGLLVLPSLIMLYTNCVALTRFEGLQAAHSFNTNRIGGHHLQSL